VPEAIPAEIPLADFVVLTVPLTPETRGMFGAREIGLMKRSAYFVNIGRGKTVDQAALVAALREGRIAGAGLDVFEDEPLPADSPLWEMEKVIVTAHYSGETPSYGERLWAIFLDNLGRYARGEPLRNVVDRSAGY
jgi:phosphoglycerate dehydrogenase-like enzyme